MYGQRFSILWQANYCDRFSLTENDGRTWEAVQELPIGGKIRIEGNGLKTANELYINGTSVDLAGIPAEERTMPSGCDYSGNFAFRECCRESDSRNKMRLVTAYDDRTLDCVIAGKQVEINRITDANGNAITEAGRNSVVVIEGKYFATFQNCLLTTGNRADNDRKQSYHFHCTGRYGRFYSGRRRTDCCQCV